MTTDLLKLSAINNEIPFFQQVDLNSLLDEVTSDLGVVLKESNAKINIDSLPELACIKSQMYQLFINLIGNGIKFQVSNESPLIHIYKVDRKDIADRCRIVVEDNGIGIDSAFFDQIFTPFYRLQTKINCQGTGAGLSICKKIVEVHNGAINVQSEPGKGSKFIIDLPLKQ